MKQLTNERRRVTEQARENRALMTELGPRAFKALESPTIPDLYVITCPKGYRSADLTLVETAQTLAMLARECGQTHEIIPAEELTT